MTKVENIVVKGTYILLHIMFYWTYLNVNLHMKQYSLSLSLSLFNLVGVLKVTSI